MELFLSMWLSIHDILVLQDISQMYFIISGFLRGNHVKITDFGFLKGALIVISRCEAGIKPVSIST